MRNLPLDVAGICIDEDAIKACLTVGMVVIVTAQDNVIHDMLSAHMDTQQAYDCMVNDPNPNLIVLFPGEHDWLFFHKIDARSHDDFRYLSSF